MTDLPYTYTDDHGPFEMRWGFYGAGTEEGIELEFTLPSDIYIGLGLGCKSSKACDMIVGNGGGGRNDPFVGDFFEVHGNAVPDSDVTLGGTNDLEVVSHIYKVRSELGSWVHTTPCLNARCCSSLVVIMQVREVEKSAQNLKKITQSKCQIPPTSIQVACNKCILYKTR